MTTAAKVGIFAAIAGLIAWLAYKGTQTAQEWANKLGVKLKSFGIPVISGSTLALPVNLAITNPVPTSITIDSVKISLFILRNGMYEQFGQTTHPAFTLVTGQNTLTLNPVIDLKKLTPTTPTLQTALNIISGQAALATVKVVSDVTVQGVSFTKEEVQQLSLNQLLRAA